MSVLLRIFVPVYILRVQRMGMPCLCFLCVYTVRLLFGMDRIVVKDIICEPCQRMQRTINFEVSVLMNIRLEITVEATPSVYFKPRVLLHWWTQE